jgi:hypothetical protein
LRLFPHRKFTNRFARAFNEPASQSYGANKGIGFGIALQLGKGGNPILIGARNRNVVLISRPTGQGSPNVTLGVHGHLFERDDTAATNAIEAAMRTRSEP